MHIAEKEAKEAHYWLRLLRDSGLVPKEQAEKLLASCEELKRILAAITKTVSRQISH